MTDDSNVLPFALRSLIPFQPRESAERENPLGTCDAAKYLGISESALRAYRVPGGGGPLYHGVGAGILYDVADLDQWLNVQWSYESRRHDWENEVLTEGGPKEIAECTVADLDFAIHHLGCDVNEAEWKIERLEEKRAEMLARG